MKLYGNYYINPKEYNTDTSAGSVTPFKEESSVLLDNHSELNRNLTLQFYLNGVTLRYSPILIPKGGELMIKSINITFESIQFCSRVDKVL